MKKIKALKNLSIATQVEQVLDKEVQTAKIESCGSQQLKQLKTKQQLM